VPRREVASERCVDPRIIEGETPLPRDLILGKEEVSRAKECRENDEGLRQDWLRGFDCLFGYQGASARSGWGSPPRRPFL